jgi:acetyl-CoA C-acetyltransferase
VRHRQDPTLRPRFKKDGTITAASSSSINDGAAALVLMSEDTAKATGARPLARIVAHARTRRRRKWFTTAPVEAIRKVLDKAGWKVGDVDLFEVNEAFATVAMAPMRSWASTAQVERARRRLRARPSDRRQRRAPARHPDPRAAAQRRQEGRRGLCIGGGEATAMAIELA